MRVRDFIPEFITALEKQLDEDELRWGDTWVQRTTEGQDERTIKKFNDYFDQYENVGTPLPYMKIIGNALICWMRLQHPEIWKK
jgi:hypothetical protein